MKIKNIKINNYGKIKNEEINLENNINIIYGKNEAGKSTILNFILNCFYGISKNKKGKEISDYEKYKPWSGESFSGKLKYELDNKKTFEIYQDFNKKNPQIFNEKMEDVSKQFNIDKSKGNEFFYEQVKIDEELFLSTVVVPQQEVKLGKTNQNILLQKITNIVGTGEDSVSFKKAMDKLNKRQLNEIGTERTKGKPINVIAENIKKLQEEKQELEQFQKIKYDIEENKNYLKKEIENLEVENNFLQELKLLNENEKIENEKINIKNNLVLENNEKINIIKNEIETIKNNNKNIFEENKKINIKNNKLNKISIIIFLIILIINFVQFIFLKNKYLNYIFILTVPMLLIVFILLKNKIIKNKKINDKNIEKINFKINNLNSEYKLLEKNNNNFKEELNKLKNNFNLKINLEKEKIKNKYFSKIEKNRLNDFLKNEKINFEKEKIQDLLNQKKLDMHSLELDYENIEPALESLSKIEEEMVDNNNKKVNLEFLERSIEIARSSIEKNYERMKDMITPKFTQNLSNIISEITNGKYTNVTYHDDIGIVVETENGNYVSAERLSVGTIDQLYLSLRLSMIEDLTEEKIPIILDETFAFYDDFRLENILKYINEKFKNHQIIIFTCTDREKNILEKNNIFFNEYKLN